MITLHHLSDSRSQRILWFLEELGVPYEVVRYERDPATLAAPAALARIHPLGKAPILVDGEQVIAESAVIIEHLALQYGPEWLPAPGSEAYRQCRYWLHYAEGSLMPLLLLKLVMGRVARGPMPFFARPVARGIASRVSGGFIDPRLTQHLAFIEASLADQPWLAGMTPTVADIQMSFPLEAARARVGFDHHPQLEAYVRRIQERPAYQRALARGGEYAYGGASRRG